MYDGPFHPTGPTVLVGTTAVLVATSDGGMPTSYRVNNILSTRQYLSWVPQATTSAPPAITVLAPSANIPSANTMGFAGLSVETVVLPPNCWVKADALAAFEITAGEGL
jgi:hypothetical protein